MKKLFLFICSISLIYSCSKESAVTTQAETQDVISFETLKSEVEQSLKNGKLYDWREVSDNHIFSAGLHSDQFFSIGYTIDPSFDFENKIQDINIEDDIWLKAKKEVYSILERTELKLNTEAKSVTDLLPYGEVTFFPQMVVHITDLNTIKELRASEYIRFVEPIGFSISDNIISDRSGSGCNTAPNYGINSSDYSNIAPGVKQPWNFNTHNIPQAWSQATGDNVRICVIDGGASQDQDNLGSQFAAGYSSSRNILKYSTHVSGSWWWASLDSPHDPCGHGTSMAGFAAAPRGNDGNAVGVAYKADLMTVRAVEDVIISSSSERNGVRDALYMAGGRNDVKIISMSIGTPFYSSTVADGIYYAYNRGKLIAAAAGTSLTWTSWYGVIFPATMSQTTAITGLKEGNGYQRCATCHDGSQVDFALVMERNNGNDRTSISLANYSNQPKYTGGSSCSTATFAGIAALVWSKDLSQSRTTVLNKLKNASDFYPSRNNNFGWGKIDAYQAVSGN